MNKITVELGGKPRELKFDMYAMELLKTIPSKGTLNNIVKMIYAGMESARYSKGLENDFTFEDAVDIADELAITADGKEKLFLINKCMSESEAFKWLIEQAEELTNEEKKSLLTGTEFTPLHLEKSA